VVERFKFQKSSQLFVGVQHEHLLIIQNCLRRRSIRSKLSAHFL
jgi:hypothetical protein